VSQNSEKLKEKKLFKFPYSFYFPFYFCKEMLSAKHMAADDLQIKALLNK